MPAQIGMNLYGQRLDTTAIKRQKTTVTCLVSGNPAIVKMSQQIMDMMWLKITRRGQEKIVKRML